MLWKRNCGACLHTATSAKLNRENRGQQGLPRQTEDLTKFMEENTTGIDWERVRVKVRITMRLVGVFTLQTFCRRPSLVSAATTDRQKHVRSNG